MTMDAFDTVSQSAVPIEPLWKDFIVSKLYTIFTVLFVCAYVLINHTKPFMERLFNVPANDYRDMLGKVVNNPSGLIPKNKVGIKITALRRRLIMGAHNPQVYSTLPLNSESKGRLVDNRDEKYYRLRVAQVDRLDEERRKTFLMNIKPIDVNDPQRKTLFGFFHPFSYASGGGEKVLWEAVMSTLKNSPNNIAVIYTFTPSSNSSVFSILDNVKNTFGVDFLRNDRETLRNRLVFIHLSDKYQWLINGQSYKILSIVGQAIGSLLLVFSGLKQLVPDVFVDTIGLPFSYIYVCAFLDLPIISYIHYPTVSRDMLFAASQIKGVYGILKYWYWWSLLKIYAINIKVVDIVLYNSTWTAENVQEACKGSVDDENLSDHILYPPCVSADDLEFDRISTSELLENKRERIIVYLAQFRPEKRHILLLRHYKEYLSKTNDPYKLVFIGSVREGKDEKFISDLQGEALKLGIPPEFVVFELNAPTEIVYKWLRKADYGINCMWKEHFGIAVVEYMLNGAIPLSHASAGPLNDIVVPVINGKATNRKQLSSIVKIESYQRSGLFFRDETDPDYKGTISAYPTLTEMLVSATEMSEVGKQTMRENAIHVAREKFGRGAFSAKWNKSISKALFIERVRRSNRGKVEQLY
ncbi:unnamed protein product [Pichia kudriavzevii]